jgi:hypothetical protein
VASPEEPIGPDASEAAGEAAGGIAGVLAGAGIGSAAVGPLGTIVGGVIGAAGGWWAGEKAAENIAEALEDWAELEEEYRAHYEEHPSALTWPRATIGYGFGHIAGFSPALVGMPFADAEPRIREAWEAAAREREEELDLEGEPEYEDYRDFVREGFERSRSARRP